MYTELAAGLIPLRLNSASPSLAISASTPVRLSCWASRRNLEMEKLRISFSSFGERTRLLARALRAASSTLASLSSLVSRSASSARVLRCATSWQASSSRTLASSSAEISIEFLMVRCCFLPKGRGPWRLLMYSQREPLPRRELRLQVPRLSLRIHGRPPPPPWSASGRSRWRGC